MFQVCVCVGAGAGAGAGVVVARRLLAEASHTWLKV